MKKIIFAVLACATFLAVSLSSYSVVGDNHSDLLGIHKDKIRSGPTKS